MVEETKLQLEASILGTRKEIASKEKELQDLKSTYPLEIQNIIDLKYEIDGLKEGLKTLNELKVELGLGK